MNHELDTDGLYSTIPAERIEKVMRAIGAQPWKQLRQEKDSHSYTLVMTDKAEKEFLKSVEKKGALPEHFMATEIKGGKIITSDLQRFYKWQDWLRKQGFKEEFDR